MSRNWILTGLVLIMIIAVGCSSKTHHHGDEMPAPESYNAHFGDMDTDGDELVGWEEFKRYFPHAEPKVFAALDLNQDGSVDHDEWHEFKEAHGLKHKE
jgi:hypothetical protein